MKINSVKNFIKNWILPPAISNFFKKKDEIIADKKQNPITEQTKSIKNRHIGERCFILGAGSSIKQQDIKKLAGECVISVSNTYVHPDYPIIKPKYHVLPYILFGHSQLHSEEKFIGWLKDMDEKIMNAEVFMHCADKRLIDAYSIFKHRKVNWVEYCDWDGDFNTPIEMDKIPFVHSVSELAITLAVYMGFDKIYLLGFDHDWFNGSLVYFYDEKTDHKVQPTKEKLTFADSEFQMRRHADIFKKYKYLNIFKNNIYNANANKSTYVDVFPLVDFNTLFENAK